MTMIPGLRPVWTRGPIPNRFTAARHVKRELMVLEAERQRRPRCVKLFRCKETCTIVGVYLVSVALHAGWQQMYPARYMVACELHDRATVTTGYFPTRHARQHPTEWCEPCSKLDVIEEGCRGGSSSNPVRRGYGPAFTGPLAHYN